uniref:PHD-type domain-containing protein n=1 Tax=Romanomermis culicivorax TaxID=13658 RepID=A0A915K538_ROMCU
LRKPTIQTIVHSKAASCSLPEIIHNVKSYSISWISKGTAQMFNNITAMPLLPIEISHIAVPVMHIQLGIAANLWSMMYNHCLNHDLQQMGMEEMTTKKSAAKIMKDKAEKCKQKKEELERIKACMKMMKRAHRIASLMAKETGNSEESDTDNRCSAELCFAEEICGDDALFWVQCDSCKKWYHAECMLVFNEEEFQNDAEQTTWSCLYCEKNQMINANTIVLKLDEKLKEFQLAVDNQRGQYDHTRLQFKEQKNLLKFVQGQAVFTFESGLDQLNIDHLAYHSGTFFW